MLSRKHFFQALLMVLFFVKVILKIFKIEKSESLAKKLPVSE